MEAKPTEIRKNESSNCPALPEAVSRLEDLGFGWPCLAPRADQCPDRARIPGWRSYTNGPQVCWCRCKWCR